ncbi:lysine transporter LysE [Pseudomonas sp. GR 6-02]|jgi:threonine/homoserine/homoserine lactone efflux protein|nr:lysine transporter LysE [Pseudomonas sp. GR 6-02]
MLAQYIVLGFTQIVISVSVNALIAVMAGAIVTFLASRPVWQIVQRWLMGMGTVLASWPCAWP